MLHRHNLVRSLATLLVILVILAGIYALWLRYQVEPVTRDGKVRADMVPVAADVAGLVTEVRVADNQPVRKGDVLFVIDRPRYRLALEQAEADLASRRVALAQAIREDRRNRAMPEVIAAETIEQGRARVEELRSAAGQAAAARDLARFNLGRTLVRAPVDGVISNVSLQPGVYLMAGRPALALVYNRSMRVEGYFEETKLPAIRVGDPASIYLMGVADEIRGHVQSIAGGVEDRERVGSDGQLANVNPTFTWVRLAQRIPVRIAIDRIPANVRMIPGQTATVVVHPRDDGRSVHRSLPW
ncbi:efflux RND transporter periplasmic adaptor subunit [Sphingomonas histidinilytica]|jgi:RND family efflux transporter MFP subunit|uniref:RND family efflux transporter, MFP subunit n=1 Tax=Rhizorhabdus histidinilytica TaxID=439228 RepID=A0A1T5DC83_9SPHN|nr:efflux RND transporter periplasmic adaptor subunit [Rhizorhabdus histidinilytica]MBO9379434.1 efflux RND transporter periplasmic adaptor subunit [Rhizorhabdus histidinilytica]QEH80202.1 efflux RND transporter periplasmic adaptor subunit [Sphingomonas sp. C8-2]SKB69295.1 RND family efflux transporter, MFP subunit [Rhizorhabdus histidinilytica]